MSALRPGYDSDVDALALANIDSRAVDRFWARFVAAKGRYLDAGYVGAFQFGDHSVLADELIELVVSGPKRATADTVAGLEARGDEQPAVGDLWVACSCGGLPRAVIETTDVRVGPLSSVDSQFAWDEGEGDRSLAFWLRVHTECFSRVYDRLGLEMHADIDVIFERFELVYAE